MTTFEDTTSEPPVAHIRSSAHSLRNALVALSLLALGGLLVMFYWPGTDADRHVSGELAQFRVAMYHRCGGQGFGGSINPQLAQSYADSDRMREMVVKQFHQLQRTNANCDEVRSALQSVDYPVN